MIKFYSPRIELLILNSMDDPYIFSGKKGHSDMNRRSEFSGENVITVITWW